MPRVITNVETTDATTDDVEMTRPSTSTWATGGWRRAST